MSSKVESVWLRGVEYAYLVAAKPRLCLNHIQLECSPEETGVAMMLQQSEWRAREVITGRGVIVLDKEIWSEQQGSLDLKGLEDENMEVTMVQVEWKDCWIQGT